MAGHSVSLKHIAEKAGVSITTVSRVLRGRGEISDETREKVQAIARQLRYRPNMAAQSIFSGRTNSIGVVIPAASVFEMKIALGIYDELAEANILPITVWSTNELTDQNDCNKEDVLKQIHQFIDRRVDGCIVRPQLGFDEIYLKEIIGRDIPLVTVDVNCLGSHADFVGTDDEAGAISAVHHLVEQGHRYIAHIAGPETTTTGRLRRVGFEKVMRDMAEIQYQILVDESFGADSQAVVKKLFDLSPLPTAVFAASDLIVTFIYKEARKRGVQIPRDMSIVGFADMEIAKLMDPPLTTVRQQPYEMGRKAARLVRENIEQGNCGGKQKILLKPELIVRSSTAQR